MAEKDWLAKAAADAAQEAIAQQRTRATATPTDAVEDLSRAIADVTGLTEATLELLHLLRTGATPSEASGAGALPEPERSAAAKSAEA